MSFQFFEGPTRHALRPRKNEKDSYHSLVLMQVFWKFELGTYILAAPMLPEDWQKTY